MYETTISLQAINDVKDFVNTVMLFNYDIDLVVMLSMQSLSWVFSVWICQSRSSCRHTLKIRKH